MVVSSQEEEIWTQTQTEGNHMETQGEDSYLKAKEKSLRENQPCNTLIPHFQPPEVRV